MPNYSLIINSRFNPFTYEELARPAMESTQAHLQEQAKIESFQDLASVYKQRALVESNQDWAQRYSDYANRLDQQAQELARNGLNASTRRAVSQLRKDYASTIVPIQNAMNRQLELAKIADSANPALRNVYGDMPTIDALIVNPTLNRATYSGSAIEASAKEMAASAATRNVKDLFQKYQTYWMQNKKEIGYSKKVMEQFRRDVNSVPELARIFKDVKQQFNNFEGLNDNQKNQLEGEILSGILKGAVYNSQVSYQNNEPALKALENHYAIQRMREQRRMAQEDAGQQNRRLYFEDIGNGEYSFAYNTTSDKDIKRTFAEKTFEYLLKTAQSDPKKNPYATNVRRYFDKFRMQPKKGEQRGKVNVEKAIQHLMQYGLTDTNLIRGYKGDNRKFNSLAYDLRRELRNNVTKNEDLIDLWTDKSGNIYNARTNPHIKQYVSTTLLENPLTDKFTSISKTQLKQKGQEIKASEQDKQYMLGSAIQADATGDVSGVYKLQGVRNGEFVASRQRLNNSDLPLNKDGSINYKDITMFKVHGGMYLKWPGGEGFLPDKAFGNQIEAGRQTRQQYIQRELPAYLDDLRQELLAYGMNTEQINQAVENERQKIMKGLQMQDYLAIPQLSRPLHLKPQEVE